LHRLADEIQIWKNAIYDILSTAWVEKWWWKATAPLRDEAWEVAEDLVAAAASGYVWVQDGDERIGRMDGWMAIVVGEMEVCFFFFLFLSFSPSPWIWAWLLTYVGGSGVGV
jgi:hypothetical protein